jgi:O-acetyl-ADP-ribose deacetylase (regulator of RNase III)
VGERGKYKIPGLACRPTILPLGLHAGYSLEAMKQHCEEHDVKKLAMPRIGCGLDRLDWNKVREMIKQTFEETNIELTIYTL